MMGIRIVFLLEERSMKVLFEGRLPRPYPGLDFLCVTHEGKQDLEKSIPRKLRAWSDPRARFVVLRDNDGADCIKLKQALVQLCRTGGREDVLVRIACQELEAWYLGDGRALALAFEDEHLESLKGKARFRDPDSTVQPSQALLELVPRFQKISGAEWPGCSREREIVRAASRCCSLGWTACLPAMAAEAVLDGPPELGYHRRVRALLPSRGLGGLGLLILSGLGGLAACDRGGLVNERQADPIARHVLVVTVDTLRADAVGAFGGPAGATPAIDALAERALVFERAYSPATITHPALSSMLTGLFPLRHGVNGQDGALHAEVVALPELLREAGIETASFVANLCKLQDQARTVFGAGWDTKVCGMDLEIEQYHWDRAVVDAALSWMAARPPGAERPWFAWVHLMDPHAEHRPPPELWDYTARPVQEKLDQYQEFGGYEERREMPPDARLGDLLDLYAAEVHGSDRELARLFEALDARIDRDSIAVVFSADHGEELFETWSRYDHGLSLTEGVLWVPLFVQAPGITPGRVAAPTELLQVTPTVLELFGLEIPYELDGASLLADEPSRGYALSAFGNVTVTLRDGEHRYWLRRTPEPYRRPPEVAPWRADAPWFLEPECLARYPGPAPTAVEWLDLETEPATTERLRAQLSAYLEALGTLRRSTRIVDTKLADQLRALGYVDGE